MVEIKFSRRSSCIAYSFQAQVELKHLKKNIRRKKLTWLISTVPTWNSSFCNIEKSRILELIFSLSLFPSELIRENIIVYI